MTSSLSYVARGWRYVVSGSATLPIPLPDVEHTVGRSHSTDVDQPPKKLLADLAEITYAENLKAHRRRLSVGLPGDPQSQVDVCRPQVSDRPLDAPTYPFCKWHCASVYR
ncbi:MAG TPA: hypothetical protein VER58_09855 [Thermoanaerobaculia bacterium]|nr:hypothetical protein [Thermoanaerobaculia bacterium]